MTALYPLYIQPSWQKPSENWLCVVFFLKNISKAGHSVKPVCSERTYLLNKPWNNKKDEHRLRKCYLSTQDTARCVLLKLCLKLSCHGAHFILLLLTLLHCSRSTLFGQLQEKWTSHMMRANARYICM